MSTRRPDPDSAAELLARWRESGRDVSAAEAAAIIAAQALESARAAEMAAIETEVAANAAAEAVQRALAAAQSAKRAAAYASEAAKLILATAEGDKVRANHEVERASEQEVEAGRRFHDAQDRGFPHGSG